MTGIGKAGFMVLKTLGLNAAASQGVWYEEFGERYDAEAILKYSREFIGSYYAKNKVPVKKGLYTLLNWLKASGCKMAVASSSPSREVERHLHDAGVEEYFSAIVGGELVTRSKPEPEIYIKACQLLNEEPENCYALEDSKNGLLAAYRAGCKAIMVPDLWQPDEETEKVLTAKFEDLEEVKSYFETL